DEPTPSEAAMLTETVERLMRCLDGRHRDILALRLQGHAPPEISSRLGCTERTVYRVLERGKQWLGGGGPGEGGGEGRAGRAAAPPRAGSPGRPGPRREGLTMSAPEQQDRAFFQGEWAWLEQVVERFEQAWQRGERPAVEEYLPAGGGSLELILELVHADLECRLKAGEAARVEAYLGRYEQLADDRAGVLRLIEAEYRLRRRREPGLGPDEYLRRFPHFDQDLVPLLGEPPGQKGGGGRGDEGPAGCPEPSCVPPPPSFPGESPRLGQFELLEVVGQGAFGTVYRARDVELGRIVAVKVPRLDYSLTPADVERF